MINKTMLYYILVGVTALDLLLPFLLAPFYKGYSHQKMVMSVLGSSGNPLHGIYNLWLIALGIALCVCAISLFQSLKSVSLVLSALVTAILLTFAIGACLLSGFFPVGETKELTTLASKIHGIGAVSGFLVMLFMPLLCAILQYKQQNRIGFSISAVAFFLAVVSFILFIMSDKEIFADSFINNEGIWQRVTLFFMYLPLDYIAILKILEK